MKFLENILHKMEPNFVKGAKYEKWNPLFETIATFAFTPKLVTTKGAHIRDGVDLKRTMMMVIIALIPCLLFGIYNTGHWQMVAELGNRNLPYWENGLNKFWNGSIIVLPLIVVSYGVGLGIEFIFGMLRGHSLHEGFLVSGMLIPLTMPADVPLWMVGVATAFAVIIGKEIFGGTGMNIINVALTARAFLFFAYPTSMSGDKVWMAGTETTKVDGFTGSTALGDLATFMSDKPVFQNLNGFTSEYTLSESFIGMIPGSVGETSTLACLIGAGILLITGVGSLRIMASFFVGGLAMGLLLNLMGGNPYFELPAVYHLVIGSFAFGAIFMATDPVSAAQTAKGKLVYGFLGGLLAILIRVLNPAYPEGVMLAILFMNISAPLIDYYVIQGNINRRLKRIKTA
ncbi:MAG: NADH:ubiquinone reductase (Na(+)-transporting) subunit B [Flavobacteriia bacterium]|nr:NADH:ubiquinone reductase (Na(+)-transporting) subunit B [Flavobacteriia bacterium]